MNLKIMVADDEKVVLNFFKTLIQREHLPISDFFEADNGLKAVSLALENKPDLIFLDIRMPGMNGLQACASIKAAWPEAEIYIISAYNEFDYAKEAFKAGVRDYLLKPVRPAQVAEIINKKSEEIILNNPPEEKLKKEVPLISSVSAYVKKNLDKPLTLGEIAKAVFISPSYLSRRFNSLTGQPLCVFIANIRLQVAAELLKDPKFSITDVAHNIGFNSSTYFSTCFRSWSGLSPSQYRKKYLT